MRTLEIQHVITKLAGPPNGSVRPPPMLEALDRYVADLEPHKQFCPDEYDLLAQLCRAIDGEGQCEIAWQLARDIDKALRLSKPKDSDSISPAVVPAISAEMLYKECVESYRYYIEWRYRMLTRFFVVISAFVVLSGWLYHDVNLRYWTFLPFALIPLPTFFFIISELRVGLLFGYHESFAEELERQHAISPGIYCRLSCMPKWWPLPYNVLVPSLYSVVGLLSIVVALMLFIRPLT